MFHNECYQAAFLKNINRFTQLHFPCGLKISFEKKTFENSLDVR